MGSNKNRKKSKIQTVVLYARVSTPEQAEKDLSLPAQLGALRQHCKERGYKVVAEYVEKGVTGRDENRPAFQQMLREVLAGSEVDAILVYQTSRFIRNVERARALKGALKKKGIRVIATCQETSDDPMGLLVEMLFEVIDQYESAVNGMRTSAAMKECAKQGYFPSSHAPFGFKVEKVEAKPNVFRSKLVPNAEEIPTHNEVFRNYVGGKGAKATARELNQRGLGYRGRLWSKDQVLKVIGESAAIGTYYWGKRDSKTRQLRDREDWIAIPVEPIIDRALFDMAQKIRAERDPEKNPGRTPSSPLLLARLVKCGKCGAAYQLQTSGKLDSKGEASYRYYNCRRACREGKEACPGCRIPTKLLEQSVLEHIADRLFTEERCKSILQDIVEETGILRQKTAEHRRLLERELADVEKRLRRWEEAFETGQLASDFDTERVSQLHERRDELRDTLSKVVPLRPPPPHLYTAANVAKFQQSIREIFLSGDTSLTRNYLIFLIDSIVITDDHVQIFAKTDAALQMMAELPPSGVLTAEGQVRATVVDWLRRRDSNPAPPKSKTFGISQPCTEILKNPSELRPLPRSV